MTHSAARLQRARAEGGSGAVSARGRGGGRGAAKEATGLSPRLVLPGMVARTGVCRLSRMRQWQIKKNKHARQRRDHSRRVGPPMSDLWSRPCMLLLLLSLGASASPGRLSVRECDAALSRLQEVGDMDDVDLAIARLRHVPSFTERCPRRRRRAWESLSLLLDLEAEARRNGEENATTTQA